MARRCEAEVKFKNRLLSATKNGKLRWILTEVDEDWIEFSCMIDGKEIKFMPGPVNGELCVNSIHLYYIELGFFESRDLERVIRTVGFINLVRTGNEGRKLARREQLNQLANAL